MASKKHSRLKTQNSLSWGDGSDMAHVRQSRPDSGRGFKGKVLHTLSVVLSSLGSGGGVQGHGGVEEREFSIDNLLARIHFIVEMDDFSRPALRQEFEFPFPGSLGPTFLVRRLFACPHENGRGAYSRGSRVSLAIYLGLPVWCGWELKTVGACRGRSDAGPSARRPGRPILT